MFLTGKNIKLVRFNDQHLNEYYVGWLNDQYVNKYLDTGRMPVGLNDLKNLNSSSTLFFAIMVVDGEHNMFIGTASLNRIDWINRKAEIGYMIGDKRFWGKGLATEAVGLLSDYALHRLNLHKVEAGVVAYNVGSGKVLEKNGFAKYGVIPEDYFDEGKYVDTHRYYKMQNW